MLPKCGRCVRLDLQCRYAHLENLDTKAVNRPLMLVSQSRPIDDSTKHSIRVDHPTSIGFLFDLPSSEFHPTLSISLDRFDYSTSVPPEQSLNELQLPDFSFIPQDYSSGAPFFAPLPTDGTWYTPLLPPTASIHFQSLENTQAVIHDHGHSGQPIHSQVIHSDIQTLVLDPNRSVANEQPSTSTEKIWPTHGPVKSLTASMTAGQASLFQSLFSLASPEKDTIPLNSSALRPNAFANSRASTWPSKLLHNDEKSANKDEDDPEGISRVMCNIPSLDGSVKSNTLPFILRSCKWFYYIFANWR